MIFLNTGDLRNDEIYLSLVKTSEAIPKRKWVPCYYFEIYLANNTKIGKCNLKIDNSDLTKYCGNIGYEIYEKYRGRRYPPKASNLLLQLAKNIV